MHGSGGSSAELPSFTFARAAHSIFPAPNLNQSPTSRVRIPVAALHSSPSRKQKLHLINAFEIVFFFKLLHPIFDHLDLGFELFYPPHAACIVSPYGGHSINRLCPRG